ncbi:hypothetical protein AX16_005347 [Volvariella volvacea WC 439]|nr:hypothetical protein AX16_005347 [Volvariella volvacea WC 439]
MSVFSPEELSALELAVETAAQLHEQRNKRSNGNYSRFFHLDNFYDLYGNLSVKYTDHAFIKAESLALQHLYDLASRGGIDAPHIPRMVHYFHSPDGWGYMIMERINLRAVSSDELHRKAACAVLWLRTHRVTFFGSLGGTNTCHTVFQAGKAPHPFTSVTAAQTYLNVAVDRVQHQRANWMTPIAEINLVDDNVVLTQSDMDPSNFGVALDGRPVVFDAATIQALPKTLADFTLFHTTPFAKAVSAYVFIARERAPLLASSNFESLTAVRTYLSTGNDDLGVDANGNVKATRRTRLHS